MTDVREMVCGLEDILPSPRGTTSVPHTEHVVQDEGKRSMTVPHC